MVDILFLTHNRLEFTKASMAAMIANTDWSRVGKLSIYDDSSTDGTREYLKSVNYPVPVERAYSKFGGPVAIMNDYLTAHNYQKPADIFAKIDNDTMLPPYWLTECLKVMDARRELDLLGIEAFNPVAAGQVARSYRGAQHIGGIGLMRRRCFKTLPHPNGRFGFTQWQRDSRAVKGWINPSLPVFLLDKMPNEPWASLSREYVANKWQRVWPAYSEDQKQLWEWWKP